MANRSASATSLRAPSLRTPPPDRAASALSRLPYTRNYRAHPSSSPHFLSPLLEKRSPLLADSWSHRCPFSSVGALSPSPSRSIHRIGRALPLPVELAYLPLSSLPACALLTRSRRRLRRAPAHRSRVALPCPWPSLAVSCHPIPVEPRLSPLPPRRVSPACGQPKVEDNHFAFSPWNCV